MASQHKFINEPDPNLICPICQDVAENPKQETNCGKIFCSNCIEKVKQPRCPNCRKKPKYFDDTRGDREIKELVVECKNTPQGCSWTGPLKDEADHVTKSCDYQMVNCKHEDIGCSEKTTRKRMRDHEEDDTAHLPLFVNAVKKIRDEKNVASGSGKIIIVQNYKRFKRENEVIKSEPFYSHPNGYKMCLAVAPNGAKEAKNTHVSILVGLYAGPYDKDLPWPFEGKVTVTLLNQIQDDHHHEVSVTIDQDNNITPHSAKLEPKLVCYFKEFISHLSLDSSSSAFDFLEDPFKKYLSNDTLYFRVSVETNQYKPWLNNNSSLALASTQRQ